MTAPAVSWTPKRKVIAQFTANVLAAVAALLVTKLGIHESAAVAAGVAGVIGIVAGAIAGYVVREAPVIEHDLTLHP
jgi:uncharacterized membrane protein